MKKRIENQLIKLLFLMFSRLEAGGEKILKIHKTIVIPTKIGTKKDAKSRHIVVSSHLLYLSTKTSEGLQKRVHFL